MDWFIKRLQHINPTLDYQDLCNHSKDFKKLFDLKIIKHKETLETMPCDLCDEDHTVSPFLNSKEEIVISCSGSSRVVNQDELKIWMISRDALIENIKSKNPIIDKKSFNQTTFGISHPKQEDKNPLKSIHLITNSLGLTTAIFLVLDGRFEMPIRFAVKNKNGDPTHIKKLYDIAYFVDAPNKMVNYDKNIADGINNGLFRKGAVAKYMKTNRLNKPTLVQKSENRTLVLKNEILVKTGLVKNDVPIQCQSIYIDKTR